MTYKMHETITELSSLLDKMYTSIVQRVQDDQTFNQTHKNDLTDLHLLDSNSFLMSKYFLQLQVLLIMLDT